MTTDAERCREGHALERLDPEIVRGQRRRQRRGEGPDFADGVGIGVGAVDLVALTQQVDEVAAHSAAGVDDAVAGRDAPAQDLVEQIDVDRAELCGKCPVPVIRDIIPGRGIP